jgi:hypothetical protein
MGVLSALPLVSSGNLCCCLWVLSGGVTAAYVLQQSHPTPITAADGALVGFLAGVVGALIYLVLSIPITFLVAPMERQLMQRLMENSGNMPPEFREYLSRYIGGGARVALSSVVMLFAGSIFSTLGGVVGAVFFRKPASSL